jgi:hypothetical protein
MIGENHLRALLTGLALVAAAANATEWVEVGADTEAKYYVDVDSISVDGENVSVQKRGVYTHVLTDTFAGQTATFKETVGTIELDCARRINRVTRIDMIGESGEVVWSSGPMKKRMWEEVRPNSHAESTLEVVCGLLNRI